MQPLLQVEYFVGIVVHVRCDCTVQHLRIGTISGSKSVVTKARHIESFELFVSLKSVVEGCIVRMQMLGIEREETNIHCRHFRLLYVIPNAVMDILMVLRWKQMRLVRWGDSRRESGATMTQSLSAGRCSTEQAFPSLPNAAGFRQEPRDLLTDAAREAGRDYCLFAVGRPVLVNGAQRVGLSVASVRQLIASASPSHSQYALTGIENPFYTLRASFDPFGLFLLCGLLQFLLNLLNLCGPGVVNLWCFRFSSRQLPLHELAEGTVRIRRKFLVRALLSNLSVGADTDDAIRSLDSRKTMRDADSSVLLFQKFAECLVNQGLRFGV